MVEHQGGDEIRKATRDGAVHGTHQKTDPLINWVVNKAQKELFTHHCGTVTCHELEGMLSCTTFQGDDE